MEIKWFVILSHLFGDHCKLLDEITINDYNQCCQAPVLFSSPCICPWPRFVEVVKNELLLLSGVC